MITYIVGKGCSFDIGQTHLIRQATPIDNKTVSKGTENLIISLKMGSTSRLTDLLRVSSDVIPTWALASKCGENVT
jgi:hypothetical protein